jgi:predicted PurR-regulated permease PerM
MGVEERTLPTQFRDTWTNQSAMVSPSDVSARSPVKLAPTEVPSLTALLTLCIFVVIVAGLYFARDILIPVTLAVLLSFVLAPIASFLRSHHLGKVPSVLVSVFAVSTIVLALGGLIGTQLADLTEEAPRYQTTIERKIEAVSSLTLEKISTLTGRLGLRPEGLGTGGNARPQSRQSPPSSGESEHKPIPVEVHQPNPSPFELVEHILTPALGPVSTLAIVFVLTVFVLLQREDLRDRFIRLFGSRDLHRTTIALDETAERLSRYLLTQIALNASFGIVISLGLLLIGVPSSLLWGVIGALLRFVPYIGALLSALLPTAVAAAVDPGWTMMLWTMALYLVVELITGQAIEPWAYGHSAGLSPIAVVTAATFWTWLWGPIGLLLSTPLTLCLVVLGRHVERLAFLDVILGDRPPLTPVENLYQRLLAEDPDEVQDQAEQLLKETTLLAYYDDVVLEALRLATFDVERGALGRDHIGRINEIVNPLIQDLAQRDAEPSSKRPDNPTGRASLEQQPADAASEPPMLIPEDLPQGWRGEAPILCIAGRGPFDGPAASMLAQLLARHGLGTRSIGNDAVSRPNIASLEGKEVAMVCVSSLTMDRPVSHLRYLLRRLRQRVPDIPILVGFCDRDDPTSCDEQVRTAIAADRYAGSLREAVEICIREAAGAESPAVPSNEADPSASPPRSSCKAKGFLPSSRARNESNRSCVDFVVNQKGVESG